MADNAVRARRGAVRTRLAAHRAALGLEDVDGAPAAAQNPDVAAAAAGTAQQGDGGAYGAADVPGSAAPSDGGTSDSGDSDGTSDSGNSDVRVGVSVPEQTFPTPYGSITLHLLYERKYSYRLRRGSRSHAPTVGDPRFYFWHPPLRWVARGDRSYANAMRVALADQNHSRERQIWASATARSDFTGGRHAELVRQSIASREATCALLPGCTWCGIPCGGWCEGFNDGFAAAGSSFACGRPICSACERALGVCDSCCYWVGLGAIDGVPGPAADTAFRLDPQ